MPDFEASLAGMRAKPEVRKLLKESASFIEKERSLGGQPDNWHHQNAMHLVQGVIRHPELLDDEIIGNVEEGFIRVPGLRRIWQGICHLKSMGIDPRIEALHEYDHVAFQLAEALDYGNWTEREVKWHACRVIRDAIPAPAADDGAE